MEVATMEARYTTDQITDAIGHRPSDRVVRIIQDMDVIVQKFISTHPDVPECRVWEMLVSEMFNPK